MQTISNNKISISVKETGAELCSLRKAGDTTEYIWTGDSRYWSGQSPVLFPIVGSLKDETVRLANKSYPMKNHGFARRSDFRVNQINEHCLQYSLRASADTLLQYPYQFELRLTYTLIEQSVHIHYEVENTDLQPIYFQLGTHPGFCCPLQQGLQLDDYRLEFEQEENAIRYFCNSSNLIVSNRTQAVLNNSNTLPLSHELFYEGALIFRTIKSQSVVMKTEKDERFVRVCWQNFPYLGIWQPKDAPFVCIEPWHGLGDPDNATIPFNEKEQMVTLQPREIFKASISVEI